MHLQHIILAVGASALASADAVVERRQAGGQLGGHLGPGEGVIGGELNNGKPYGYAGGAFDGFGYTQTIGAREAQVTAADIVERQLGGSASGHLGPGEGVIGGDLNNGKPYGYAGGDINGMGTTITLAAREAQATEIGGGLAGTEGPFQGTAGGAINGPTGFVEGCLGGAVNGMGTTACFPVETAPAETKTGVQGGNAVGTFGPASGFLSAPGLCAGGAVGNDGFTTCLMPTATA